MDSAGFLAHLRTELDSFRACLDGDLTAPIQHCGDWTLRDLADHLGGGNFWVATAVTENRNGDHPSAPEDPAALLPWFDESCVAMLSGLEADPDAAAWTFHPPHNVGFWQRRRCMETLIHRWDAEHALGIRRPMVPELAGEGVLEVFEVMVGRMIVRGLKKEPEVGVRFVASDSGAKWVYGPGEPIAEVSGSAEDLVLLLWGRRAFDDGAFDISGDWERAGSALASMTP
jgi:uncharacterized protein (TIGR03083 family)